MVHKLKYISLIVLLLSFIGLLTSCGAVAKPTMLTVGIFTVAPSPAVEELKNGLKKQGYVENENVIFVIKDAGGDAKKMPQVAQEMVAAKPNVVMIVGAGFSKAMLAITSDIPLVVAAADPIKEGVVPSLKDHGLNVTGVAVAPPIELQLDYLLKVVPQAKRILVPLNPNAVGTEPANFARAEAAAKSLGLEFVVSEARNDEEAVQKLAQFSDKVEAIFLPTNRVSSMHDGDNFVPFAIAHKLPLMLANGIGGVKQGGLIGYGADTSATTDVMARLAVKILKGSPASQLPFETVNYTLSINLKTAAAIGLTVPDDILRQADEIIR